MSTAELTSGSVRAYDPGHDPGSAGEVFVFPMSYAQQRLWFIDRLQPNAWTYNMAGAFRLEGQLDADALRKSINEIARRHEVLRTTFDLVDGVPSQVIRPVQSVDWDILDLRSASRRDAEEAARQYLRDQSQTPFDLAHGPVFRARLIQLGEREQILFTAKHHIISDAWSEEVFMREISAFYSGFVTSKAPLLPDLPIQYADYAQWQRGNIESPAVQAQLAYWKKQLAGPLPVLQLPSHGVRPAVQTAHGGSEPILIPAAEAAALRQLGQKNGATLFMTLLAVFKVFLARITATADVIVGTPIANRNRSETENLIGFFLNTLTVRTDLSGNPRFVDALARVREAVLGAYQNPDIPFEMLVEELHPERNLNQNPLCQVMFVLQNEPAAVREMGGLKVEPIEIESIPAQFDLTLELVERGDAVTGAFVYNADALDAETVKRWQAHFALLLREIIADPECPIALLPLLTEPERKTILEAWNDTGRDYPAGALLHRLFEEQAARTPKNTALIFGEETCAYAELNARANRLTGRLRELGVTRDVLVGIQMERSIELVVALLAVLKAGGAYVPLDPSYPTERLSFMVEDARMPVILTQRKLAAAFSPGAARLLCVEEEEPALAARPETNLAPQEETPADLAYVIYTSGTTGRPKGVMIPHSAICNHMFWMQEEFPLTEADRVLQKTPVSFDASVWEFYAPLLAGAALVLAAPEGHRDSRYLARALTEHGITILQLVPSVLDLLLAEPGFGQGSSLKRLFCGGEPLSPGLCQRVFSVLDCELINLYGPTECAIDATFHRCARGETVTPIGRPVANTRLYLLDASGNPVPAGVAGELCIAGPQLARGYLNDAALTAARFVQWEAERIYKTGDLAAWDPNGNVLCLGRIDQQVKLRGRRIELGEIESVLKLHPDVLECAAVLREETSGDKRLAAYVVSRDGSGLSASVLQEFLRGKLPDYMVPPLIITLPALPRLPNGKLDRAALPADPALIEGENSFVAPRDEIEKRLVEIWEESLNRHPVCIYDNFFYIGGHSLLAVGLFAQIEQKLGKSLPLTSLFNAPTVAQLATLIRQKKNEGRWASLVPIQPLGKHPPFFCVHGGDGGVLFYSELGRRLAPDQPLYGVQAQGWDGKRIENASAEEMSAYYLREIRELQPAGPYYLGGYSFGGIVAMEMAQQLMAEGEQVAFLALFDTYNPAVPPRRFTLPERISLRLRDMARMKWRHKLGYLLRRATGKALIVINQHRTNLKMRFLKREIEEAPIIPTELRYLHVRETSSEAFFAYKPSPFRAPITVFRAQNPPDGYEYDAELGWRQIARAGLQIIDIVGAHESIFAEPNVRLLAAKLQDALARARAASRSMPGKRPARGIPAA